MIVGPRYNDVDPAVEAAYERAAEAETATSKLDAIAARLEAATPGPWEAVTDNDGRTKEHSVWSEQSSDYVAEWIVTKPDADLIAHAPADLAALVAVVREVAEVHRPGDPECVDDHHDPARCPCAVAYCDACGDPAPCTTAKALNRLEETDAG